jgi:hypothetical protein
VAAPNPDAAFKPPAVEKKVAGKRAAAAANHKENQEPVGGKRQQGQRK